ncbi:unnamed protein product [Phyllotreta striolata]|uniref:BPTI/Kunitz inhibitor domain-containing protein n=1 Tax=Phyllotreta striolata TaxID=444603 RepID=A0A9N9TJC4_PHYSR|nr:unnamed protein product [Phyllotreta striolata]
MQYSIICIAIFTCIWAKPHHRQFTPADCWKSIYKDSAETERDCKAIELIYRWNVWEHKCQPMVFGSCNPSRNVFYSMEECRRVAQPVCAHLLPLPQQE